jgi:hypothetical protein
MRKVNFLVRSLGLFVFSLTSVNAFSQEEGKSPFSAGADFYSTYVFRGTKYGTGPHVQPIIKFTTGPFTAGGWGSFDFNGYQEADLYFSFSLPAGFSAGVTDYYYPDLDYFDFSSSSGSHAYEINAGFTKAGLTLSANYILNEAGGIGSSGGDMYFQGTYYFKYLSLFLGAGNGWHTSDNKFKFCNAGLGTSVKIKITESFQIPVVGQVIFNPEREKMYLVVGLSF